MNNLADTAPQQPLYRSVSNLRPEAIAEVLNRLYAEHYSLREILPEAAGSINSRQTYTILLINSDF